MSIPVHYDVDRRVAVLTIDHPPVNALSAAMWDALEAAVARASADPDVDAVVLMGAGSTFIAGADVAVFDTLTTREASLDRSGHTHALLLSIEDAPKPIVAAIHGHALGGGLEVAMACHFRVAVPDTVVGQPEVLLGIIPGAGGTQRLPRLCGAARALEMCTGGKPVAAPDAVAAGILDALVEGDLRTEAVAFASARAAAGDIRRTRERTFNLDETAEGLVACQHARDELKTPRGVLAPWRAIEGIEAGLTLSFDAGSERERDLFADAVISTESKALRHLFFAEREAAKVQGITRETPTRSVRSAAVVGAGTMGIGIAICYANADIPVLLKEVDEVSLDRGLTTIRAHYASAVARGRMAPDAAERAVALITPTIPYDRFSDVDIVVEAVFEDLALKKATFADLGASTRADCVLASNTSTLDIDALAAASGRPTDVVGHHFFSPANVMKLLEVVRGGQTSPTVLATSVRLARRLGKVPVVVGNAFGFVANRLLGPYLREAALLLEDGASVQQIDRVLMEFGLPVGPFGLQDIAGIDVGARIRQQRAATGGHGSDGWNDSPQSFLPDTLFAMGRFGQKTGAGWYRYEPGSRTRIPDPVVDELVAAASRARGISRRAIDDDEILARCMRALADEGARVLDEGVAARAGDIDVIYCHGFGFPRHRGGPMFYKDTEGC